MSLNADIHARFLREGVVANQVDDPGAVRVLDNDTAEDGSAFLVMELLEGDNLESMSRAAGGRLSPRVVAELARHLLDVLAVAHDKGIVHRDIKPENLFVTRGGTLKVLDFGIARLDSALGLAAATRTGRTMGTPAFMAPEQALGDQRAIDARTDVWAVGATMFTLLAGQFVHEGDRPEALLVHSGSRSARPLSSVAPEVPAALASVVDRALAFERDDRWSSAREMATALDAACEASFPDDPLRSSKIGEPLRAREGTSTLAAYLSAPSSARKPGPDVPQSTTGGTARAQGDRPPSSRWAWLAAGAIPGIVVAAVVALYGRGPTPATTRSVRGAAAQPRDEASPAPGSTFDCHLVSPMGDVGSLVWTRGALFLLAGNKTTRTIDLLRLGLASPTTAAPEGARVVHSFPSYNCTTVGELRTCGFWDTSVDGVMLRDGSRLVFAISADPSSCNTETHTECDWSVSTCGSVWALDFANLGVEALSKEEAWVTGLATSEGTRLLWSSSSAHECSPSAVRMYQPGNGGARTIQLERPGRKDAAAAGGGVAVVNRHLYWLSSGMREWTDGGLADVAPRGGVLYESGSVLANAAQEMEPRVLATGLDRPAHLISDGAVAYFSSRDGRVYRIEDEALTTMTNLGVDDTIAPRLALARTKRTRFVVAAVREKLTALSATGEILATAEAPGYVRNVTADAEGQAGSIFAYAATENGVFACEAR